MKGDIALAGFVLTAQEWQELDAVSRAQLMAAMSRRDDPWVVAGSTGLLAEQGGEERT
jgi:hypothetical protein